MGGGGSHHLERSPNFYFFRSPLIDVPHPVTTAADNLPEQSGTEQQSRQFFKSSADSLDGKLFFFNMETEQSQ